MALQGPRQRAESVSLHRECSVRASEAESVGRASAFSCGGCFRPHGCPAVASAGAWLPPRLIFLVLSSSPVIAKHVTFKLSLAEKNVNLSKVHCSRMETLMWFYFKIL